MQRLQYYKMVREKRSWCFIQIIWHKWPHHTFPVDGILKLKCYNMTSKLCSIWIHNINWAILFHECPFSMNLHLDIRVTVGVFTITDLMDGGTVIEKALMMMNMTDLTYPALLSPSIKVVFGKKLNDIRPFTMVAPLYKHPCWIFHCSLSSSSVI